MTNQWDNLPERRRPATSPGWEGFAVDPRRTENAEVRAADADRQQATSILGAAYADGRLTHEEYEERLDEAIRARRLGELVPLVEDVIVPAGAQAPPPGRIIPPNVFRGIFASWIIGALLFNAIWLMTSLTAGELLYYWPMWPMLGTAIPVLIGLIPKGGGDNDEDEDEARRADRQRQRSERHERRELRRGRGDAGGPPELPNSDDLR